MNAEIPDEYLFNGEFQGLSWVQQGDVVRRMARAEKLNTELTQILEFFLEDPRFEVHVGGNPKVVVAMLKQAHDALDKARKVN